MTCRFLETRDLSDALVQILVDKSEGNPLYVEEILRELQETAVASSWGTARPTCGAATSPSRPPSTTSSRPASTVSRDLLKRTLQGAAVVGRRFGVALLSRVLEGPPRAV